MKHWLCRTFDSSIGKKTLMAMTGLLLCGFLVTHLTGNLLLFVGEKEFMDYVHMLEANKLLLYTAETVLLAVFLIHIFNGLRVNKENKDARPIPYQFSATAGSATFASRTMLHTGGLILVFLILHIATFKFGTAPGETLYANVLRRFAHPAYSFFYIFAVILLGVHVSHGLQSAFQSLGLNHAKYTPLIKKLSLGFGVFIALGFSSFPLYFMMRGGQL